MRVKGTSIASFISFLETEYGQPRLTAFVSTLEPTLKKRCEGLILASAFYEQTELDAIAVQAKKHFSGDASFFERSGVHNAVVGLNGVYKALLARPNPLDFLRAAERAWSQFADSGTITLELVDEGRTILRLEGLPVSDVQCERQTGFLRKAIEMAGGKKSIVKKQKCTRSRDLCCEWAISWDPEASPKSQVQTQTAAIRRPVAI